jgi:hypothetical protein
MTGTRDALEIDLGIILGKQWKMIGRDDVELFLSDCSRLRLVPLWV